MATTNTIVRTASFANGEISRRARWKSWTEQFQSGCLALRNFITGDYGEIARRPGVCITSNPQLEYGIPNGMDWIYACTLEDKKTGNRRQVLVYTGGKQTLGVADLTMVKNQHPDFGGVTTTDLSFVKDSSVKYGTQKLRHASYDGEEYFVGVGCTPFKLRLEDKVVYIKPIDFLVEPMRDTVVEGDAEFSVSKTDESGDCTITISGDATFDVGLAGDGHTLMLVNYDAKANYSKKIKFLQPGASGSEDVYKDAVTAAPWTSEVFPAFGTVTLTAEGSYWAGKITLVERIYSEDGKTYSDKDVGSIVSSGVTGTRSLPVTVTDIRSEVYIRLDELYDTPTYTGNSDYKDMGVVVSLAMSGAQEVFFKVKGGNATDNTLVCSPINHYGEAFKSRTYAVSALMPQSGKDSVGVRTICCFQDRIVFGGTTEEPKKIWMSKTGKPTNFLMGTKDDDAVAVSVSGSDDEEICWMSPREGLVIGTTAREYSLTGSSNPAVTPTSINVSKPNGATAYGNVDTESYNGEEGIFCLRAGGKDLLFYRYSSDTYSYIPAVLNNVNLEIFGDGGAKEIAVATRPRTTVYALRDDGNVACLRYFGANGVVGWSVLSFPFKVRSIVAAKDAVETKDVLYLLFDDVSPVARTAVGVLVDGEYIDRFWINEIADKKTRYVSEVHTTPWLLSDNDAWGRKVSVNKTSLCLNTARSFETSLDGGKTWTKENRNFDSKTGKQIELTDEEYELRSMSGWRPQAELWLRTDDEHELVLNAVRAGMTVS